MVIMDERRRHVRAHTYLAGRAAFAWNSSAPVECVVGELSAFGAWVQFAVGVTVPSHFDLLVGQSGRPHRARVIWRHASEVGVTFLEERAAPEVMPG